MLSLHPGPYVSSLSLFYSFDHKATPLSWSLISSSASKLFLLVTITLMYWAFWNSKQKENKWQEKGMSPLVKMYHNLDKPTHCAQRKDSSVLLCASSSCVACPVLEKKGCLKTAQPVQPPATHLGEPRKPAGSSLTRPLSPYSHSSPRFSFWFILRGWVSSPLCDGIEMSSCHSSQSVVTASEVTSLMYCTVGNHRGASR